MHNLQVWLDNAGFILGVLSLVGLLLCTAAFVKYGLDRSDSMPSAPEWKYAYSGQITSVKIAAALSVLMALGFSVPSPDHDLRIVEKPVLMQKVKRITKTVVLHKPSTASENYELYKSAKRECYRQTDGSLDADEQRLCHEQAMQASGQTPRVITREVVKRVPVPYGRDLRYRELYATCMGKGIADANGGWTISENDSTQLRTQRIEICHRQVMEVLK